METYLKPAVQMACGFSALVSMAAHEWCSDQSWKQNWSHNRCTDGKWGNKSAYFLFSIFYYLNRFMAFLFLFFGCALSHTLFENIPIWYKFSCMLRIFFSLRKMYRFLTWWVAPVNKCTCLRRDADLKCYSRGFINNSGLWFLQLSP